MYIYIKFIKINKELNNDSLFYYYYLSLFYILFITILILNNSNHSFKIFIFYFLKFLKNLIYI